MTRPLFFPNPARWREWLEKNHDKTAELWVGFYRKDTGKPSITWPQSVDEALCFGWIDGVRKSLDETRYVIRFTPRKARSIWSAVNIKRAKELVKLKRMHRAGLAAFEKRDEKRANLYSFERKSVSLGRAYEKTFKANPRAWGYFQSQAPYYRRTVAWWVISAKQEETRLRRLAMLIRDCEAGVRMGPLRKQEKTR